MSTMKKLVLTTGDSGAGALKGTGLAESVIWFEWRFVCGKLPSPAEVAASFSPRSATQQSPNVHWLDHLRGEVVEEARARGLGFFDFCEQFESIELWIDPEPNAQLILVWLLDFLRPHRHVISKLLITQSEINLGERTPEALMADRPAVVSVTDDHLETASAAWQAWRGSTPQAWLDLLARDLSVLPKLSQSVVELLEDLPHRASGLGATELQILELLSAQVHAGPTDLFPCYQKSNERRVFAYWEVGALLDGLAFSPAPAITGLEEGPFTLDMHQNADRHKRYKQSKLSLTALGRAVLSGTDDFSRHNPIHRWWGGTELTNDRLWRWDPVDRALIAP
jgi:hypothetical protein